MELAILKCYFLNYNSFKNRSILLIYDFENSNLSFTHKFMIFIFRQTEIINKGSEESSDNNPNIFKMFTITKKIY